jgi:hypothetical protein
MIGFFSTTVPKERYVASTCKCTTAHSMTPLYLKLALCNIEDTIFSEQAHAPHPSGTAAAGSAKDPVCLPPARPAAGRRAGWSRAAAADRSETSRHPYAEK